MSTTKRKSKKPVITDEMIKEYLREKITKLRASVPGYITLGFDVSSWRDNGITVSCKGYNEHTSHIEGDTLDQVIEKIVKRVGGKSEAEMLRNKALVLLKEADLKDAQSKA